MKICKYPEFEDLTIQHKDLIESALCENEPEISEFTFTNLYAWRDAYKFSLSELDGFIIVKVNSSNSAGFYDPIGNGDKKAVISRILNDTNSVFTRVPQGTKMLFDNDPGFIPGLDPNNSDYLYKVSDLVNLPGKKYDGKRNLIKNFRKNNKYDYIKLDESSVEEISEFENRWCSIKNCDIVESLSHERMAIKEMLNNYSSFNIIGGAIRMNGNIYAVSLAERLNADTMVMDVLKADPDIPGLYQAILNEFMTREQDGFEYVNFEQDLGVPGLRKAKRSYHPVRMIDKYTIKMNKGG